MEESTPPIPQTPPNVSKGKKQTSYHGNDIMLKALILLVVLLIIQIPVLLIQDLISDRIESRTTVVDDIEELWGKEVKIKNPSWLVTSTNKEDEIDAVSDWNLKVNVNPQELKRGIYNTRVYEAQLKYSFDLPSDFVNGDNSSLYIFYLQMVLKERIILKGHLME